MTALLSDSSRGEASIPINHFQLSAPDGYRRLFGESGAALSDTEWVNTLNNSLPPSLSSLNARFELGSRSHKTLKVFYEPGPQYFSVVSLSNGAIVEMLDQAAAHCGSFVTSYFCLTLTMRVNYLRAGTGSVFVSTARVLEMITSSGVVRADLAGDRGRRIASASVAVQLIKDFKGYT